MEKPEWKQCARCLRTRHRDAFSRRASSKDGLQSYCKACRKAVGNCPIYNAAYNASERGIARNLSNSHGYSEEDAAALATDILNPNVRCGICGIPQWMVALNHKRGGPFFIGTARMNTRMHPDRINVREPHTLANTRLLCPTCNLRRGPERFADKDILRWVRYRWLSIFPIKKLWWLNTEPGVGGRLYRSPACEKRDARFAERSLVEEAFNEPTKTPDTESPSDTPGSASST